VTLAWRITAQAAAGDSHDAAQPVWSNDVPFCAVACPLYDSTRHMCRRAAARPVDVCEPTVAAMAKLLTEVVK
jgi:hypothetical protein